MAISAQHLDRQSIEVHVFDIARQLLAELGSYHARESVRGSAHLDRDLGLGSLERVELFVRLDRAFGLHLPESVVGAADTLDDVVAAVAANTGAAPSERQAVPERGRVSLSSSPSTAAPPETVAPAPESAETWQDVLRYRAAEDAARPHLILCGDSGEAQRISFGELYAGAQRAALGLARHGVVRGDAVALMLPTCPEFFLIFAGILLAGAVPVPIYPPVRADRIAEYAERQSAILRNAEARLLVTFAEAERVAKLLRPSVKSLRGTVTAAALLAASGQAPNNGHDDNGHDSEAKLLLEPLHASANELALLQYTSGSTGNPKGVMLTHANLLSNVRAIGEALAIRATDVGISWLPLYHDMGLIGAWLMPLYFGLPVAVLSPISFLTRPERWLWAVHKHGGTLTAAPNFAYELAVRKIADADLNGLDLSTLRAVLNGAEPVNADTLERFAKRFASSGFRREALLPVYGLAEGSLAVTIPPLGRGPRIDRIVRETFARDGRAVNAPSGPKPASASPVSSTASSRRSSTDEDRGGEIVDPGLLSIVSVGPPVPLHEVRVVDAGGQEVPDRMEGAIWFRGPSSTRGYLHNPEASASLFPEGQAAGWLNSGDRGYRADGEIFITGRVKDMILKAGRNLYPHEIEEIAATVKGVRKGCVVAFGCADSTTGTERLVIVAEVVAEVIAEAAQTRERDSTGRQRIATAISQRVAQGIGVPPDAVELLSPHTIPKTSSGKLRRNETRELYLAGTLGDAAPPAWLQVSHLALSSGVRAAAQWGRGVLEFLYGVYAGLGFVLWLIPAWLIVRLMPDRKAAARFTSVALRGYLALALCRVRVLGREHWQAPGPRVIVSNHTSYFDVLVLMAALGVDYHFVAKREVRSMPFIGTFLRKLEHFAFDRSDSQARLDQATQIEEALRKGESVFVFPEGTFTPQAGVRPFQLGAFKAAATVHCPVIPIALAGARRFLRDGSYLPRPSRITITICPPLVPVGTPGPVKSEAAAERFAPPENAPSDPPAWREIVRLRDAAREEIGRASGEPLL